MKQNYTHIALLIDRSGSMNTIKSDMEGGIASFMETQAKEIGTCTVTAAHFDDEYEVLFTRIPISDVNPIVIKPRGLTSLVDSMVRLINDVGVDIDSLPEDEKPDRVLFIVITDGYENSSREFTSEHLRTLIKEQEDKYSWNFTYIGANQDAFLVAKKYGLGRDNTMSFSATTGGVRNLFTTLSNATSRYRSKSGVQLNSTSFSYTEDEQNNSKL